LSDIVVIGSLNMDLVVTVGSLPKKGETVRGSDLMRIPGGKGANQATVASLLGSQVSMIGSVGQDEFGSILINNLSRYGVDTTGIIIDPQIVTGTALIMVDRKGDNSIVISPGANSRTSPEDIDRHEELIKKAKLVLLQLEIPLNTISHVIDLAQKHHVPVVLNPAPVAEIPTSTLKKVSYLIPNEIEAAQLSGIDVQDLHSAEQAANKFLDLGVEVVVITLGRNGCLVKDRRQTLHAPAPKVKVIDSTAAGDAFIGAFSSRIIQGHSLSDAARFANCAGALTVTRRGAQTSLPTLEEMNKYLSEIGSTQLEVTKDPSNFSIRSASRNYYLR
jgi:ribokinase